MSHANAEAYCAGIDGHLAYWDLNLINFGSIENALDTFSGSQTYWTAGKLESDGYYWHPSGKSEQYFLAVLSIFYFMKKTTETDNCNRVHLTEIIIGLYTSL